MSWILIVDTLTILNTALILGIVISVAIWTRTSQANLLLHRNRLEQSILHLEAEIHDLKAGSIIQLPPAENGPPP